MSSSRSFWNSTTISITSPVTMVTLDDTDYVRVATNTAEHFVEGYYNALNGARQQLASFYVKSTKLPTGQALPHISYNGEVCNDPAAFQTTFKEQMPYTHYEVQSFDVHVLNPSITTVDSSSKKDHEQNMSFIVQVSGYVRLHERKDGPIRGFSDNVVLVPNKEEVGGRQTGKLDHGHRWVIQTQNFRFVT